MKGILETGKLLLLNTFGDMAATALILCAASGVFLAIPYDVNNPYGSVSLILLANEPANFIRNLHYWTAQLFLAFTILHIFDHFLKKTEKKVKRYQWTLLVITVGVSFYAMISGFILKGDPDGMQAYRILSSILSALPWIGDQVRHSLMGDENNLQLIYVHHVATATAVIIAMTYNHAGRIFAGHFPFFVVFFVALIISFFAQAPLHDGFSGVTKGPWYFLGLQEMLHWMSRPAWIWAFMAVILIIFLLIREVSDVVSIRLKLCIAVVALIYLALIMIGVFFRGENWEWRPAWQTGRRSAGTVHFSTLSSHLARSEVQSTNLHYLNDRAEGCLLCHSGLKGLTPSHDPAAIGCSSCHAGNPFAADKSMAHKGMIRIPGNLSDAARSCGTARCHPDIPARIDRSLMTTASGLVSVDRYVFGSRDSLSGLSHIARLGHDAADQHLRDLCANCHLGMRKADFGPVTSLSRGGGCNACHLNYSQEAARELASYLEDREGYEFRYHPSLDLEISDGHCFGCHSRSGRISLSYAGLHETLLDAGTVPEDHLALEDGRVVKVMSEDVHHKAGMRCVDCHHARELMGDGYQYRHKEEQVQVTCVDCHRVLSPSWASYSDLDRESAKIATLKYPSAEHRAYLGAEGSGLFYLNIQKSDSGLSLGRKDDGTMLTLNPPAEICLEGNAHDRLECGSCHSGWVPQCIGCHNVYDKDVPGMDLLEMKEKTGSWVEYVSQFLYDAPVLGIKEDGGKGRPSVSTFTPGMVLSIALESFPENEKKVAERFHRLYAPISAHTTQATGRDCNSCHLDPLTLGYGRGKLVYHPENGKWEFRNRFAQNAADRLPEDAWTGFLQQRDDLSATRYGMRPFNIQEQRSILLVGACLTCHDQDSPVMRRSLTDFDELLRRRSAKCSLPVWD